MIKTCNFFTSLLILSILSGSLAPAAFVFAEGETTIVTGDASSQLDVENEVNTNETNAQASPEPSPSPEPTPADATSNGQETISSESSPSPEPSPSPSSDASATPSPSPDVSPVPSASPSPSVSPSPEASPEPSASPESSPSPNPSSSPDPSASPSPSPTPDAGAFSLSPGGGEPGAQDNGGNGDSATTSLALSASSTNDAVIGTSGTSSAQTGDNAANNNSGTTTIATGDAGASANVLTVGNTNVVDGGLVIISENGGGSGDIDTRTTTTTATSTPATTTCSSGCLTSLESNATNNATSTTDLAVSADTGGNEAVDNAGGTMILTGNAFAAANIINILNANFISSQFMLVTVNKTGDFDGDIVFPGKWFFEQFAGLGSSTLGSLDAFNANRAVVENIISVESSTGFNTATSGKDALVVTGGAYAAANTQNVVNTNIVGGGPFIYVLVNVGGIWGGTVFSLPPGAGWNFANGGLTIEMEGVENRASCCINPFSFHSTTTNTAYVRNNVSVRSSTGGNSASSTDDVVIGTGHAFAAANILNLINTNFIGINGLIALINIGGNWSGNVAFGRPDLWLGASASAPSSPLAADDRVLYTFTITNRGDADATGVTLWDKFTGQYLSVFDERGGVIDGLPGRILWNIGTIAVGETVTRSYAARVRDLPPETTELTHSSSVTSKETDGNPADNNDFLSLLAYRPSSKRSQPWQPSGTWPPELAVTKTSSATTTVAAPGVVHYAITVVNKGDGPAYRAFVADELRDPEGRIIDESVWDLDYVYPYEEIIIEYDIEFASTSPSGLYVNSAYAEGRGGNEVGYVVRSNIATSSVDIKGVDSKSSPDGSLSPKAKDGEEEGEIVGELQEQPDTAQKIGDDTIERIVPSPVPSPSPVSRRKGIVPEAGAALLGQNGDGADGAGGSDPDHGIGPLIPERSDEPARERSQFASLLGATFSWRILLLLLAAFGILLAWRVVRGRRPEPLLPD